jgi:murein DD-endopeptidase MepM/ murein hydrolase activator NlpD
LGIPGALQEGFNSAGRFIGRTIDAARAIIASLTQAPIAFFTRISSGFGMRVHPLSGERRMHTGVDYAAGIGTPVEAAGDGRVRLAASKHWYGGYGRAIIIDHGQGVQTLYGHLSVVGVVPGQVVHKGMIIGKVGKTGYVTGPHLHYEMRRDGVPFNPLGH